MERIGPYEPSKELGRGGMGVVLRARCTRTGREVALKVLHGLDASEDERARFAREVAALMRLRHPSIVGFLEAGTSPRGPWVAMELVEGESLQARVQRDGPLEPGEATTLARTLCGALESAHAMGVVHRDVKPQNVLLARDGRVVLVDFGLARLNGRQSRLTLTGEVLGTPCYMAPEQADGRPCGPAADVYGVGALLYEALTGQPPLRGTTLIELLNKVLSVPPARPETLRPGLPAALSDVVMRCLEKDPARRPESAAALAAALERVDAAPARPAAPRRRLVPAVAVLGVALLAASFVHARGAARGLDEAARAAGALDVQALLMRGRAQLKLYDWAGALASAEAGLALEGRSAQMLGLRAGALLRLGRREEALAHCREIATLGCDQGEAVMNGAAVALSCDEFDLALDLVARVAPSDPRHATARCLRFIALVKSGRRAEAVEHAERILREGRAALEEVYYLVEGLKDLDPARAIEPTEQALARWPDEVRLHVVLALALERQGERSRALDSWSEVLARWPDELTPRIKRARLYLSLGDASRAAEEAELVAARSPDSPGAWELLVDVRQAQGQWSAAYAAMTRLVTLRPRDGEVRTRRAGLALRLDDRDGAMADLEAAVELEPERAMRWANLAEVRRETGDLAGALAAGERAVALSPNEPEAYMSRGETHRAAGRPAEARRDFTRALELHRDPKVKRELRQALERLPE